MPTKPNEKTEGAAIPMELVDRLNAVVEDVPPPLKKKHVLRAAIEMFVCYAEQHKDEAMRLLGEYYLADADAARAAMAEKLRAALRGNRNARKRKGG